MADRSFAWAKARGLVRDNTVHGEEEARLVLEDSFANENEKGEMTSQHASGLVEDPVAKVLHLCSPDRLTLIFFKLEKKSKKKEKMEKQKAKS